MAWSEYWNSSINVNNKILGQWSEYYYRSLTKLNKLSLDDNVLDYGAGTGVISGLISSQVKTVLAYDNSEVMNNICVENMIKYKNVFCLSKLNNNKEITFILINSVLQYINSEELEVLLEFASKKTSATRMIISDIVPEDYNPYVDAVNNLYYSLKNHFLFAYLFFLIKEFIIRLVPNKTFVWNKYNMDTLTSSLEKYGWKIDLIDNLSPSVNRYSLFCYRDL